MNMQQNNISENNFEQYQMYGLYGILSGYSGES